MRNFNSTRTKIQVKNVNFRRTRSVDIHHHPNQRHKTPLGNIHNFTAKYSVTVRPAH